MLSLDFSYAQRLIFTAKHIDSTSHSNNHLDSRVYALFASIFFLADSALHFLAGTYKSFIGTTVLILGTPPTKQYKEARYHFAQMLRYLPFIIIGSPLGLVQPNAFQSKELQEYLRWKTKLFHDQASQFDEYNQKNIEVINNALQRQEPILPNSTSEEIEEDNSSIASEEYHDTYEDFIIQSEKEQQMQKEIFKLKNLLAKEQEKGSILDSLFLSLESRHPYNQVLLIKKFTEKYLLNTPTILEYTSNLIKEEINAEFTKKLKISFCEFCRSTNPSIQPASEIFKKMLDKYTFRSFINPSEALISTAISFI